jgi:phytoene dehydrogenase-like protein
VFLRFSGCNLLIGSNVIPVEQKEGDSMNPGSTSTPVIVIGGGLAGLTAAASLARAGRSVTLFEKSHLVGGRAATEVKHGFSFNLGPHALYRKGPGISVLRELGVTFTGDLPSTSGGYAIDRGRKHTLPIGLFSMLTSGLFGLGSKLEVSRLLASIPHVETNPIQHDTLRDWLRREVKQDDARRFMSAVFRLTTYANDEEHSSAGAAIEQLIVALAGNVLYIDGGWQTLVDGLRRVAKASAVRIVSGARVSSIEHDRRVRGVRLSDGTFYPAEELVLAVGPIEASELVEDEAIARWAHESIPIKMATLDLALGELPQPRATFALGIDLPLYFSVHSAAARLAPAGGALIHVAGYLGSRADLNPKLVEGELEKLVDLMQPGWRSSLVERRFLPALTVSNAVVTARNGGMEGRPGPQVPEIDGLFLAGDWVGSQGMLADASLASGRTAARLIIERAPREATAVA